VGATLPASTRHLARLHQAWDPLGAAATRLLPATARAHVQALCGLAAHVAMASAVAARDAELAALPDRLEAACHAGGSDELLLAAPVQAHLALGLDVAPWRALVAAGASWEERHARLLAGLVAPALAPRDERAAAHLADLAAAAHLARALAERAARGEPPAPADVARARRLLVSADLGLPSLPPAAARAVRAHRQLLADELRRVERTAAASAASAAGAPVRPLRPALGRRARLGALWVRALAGRLVAVGTTHRGGTADIHDAGRGTT